VFPLFVGIVSSVGGAITLPGVLYRALVGLVLLFAAFAADR
jgi:hypothetical protein